MSFSVPTVLAGAAVGIIGLAPTAYGYGAIVIVLSAITTIAVSRRLRALRGATVPTLPEALVFVAHSALAMGSRTEVLPLPT